MMLSILGQLPIERVDEDLKIIVEEVKILIVLAKLGIRLGV